MGQVETTTYNPAGERTSLTDFTGKTTRWTHDSTGRPTTIDYPTDADVTFAHTATGQRSTVTDGHGTTTHAHDARDRLVRRTDSAGRVIEYSYDAAGNLLSRVTASQTLVYRYDERNRLVAVESSVAGGPVRITRYAYDAHGTRTQMIASDGTTTEYRYDRRSRLRELRQRSAAAVLLFSATYATDAAGLRTGITEADEAGTTRTVAYEYDQTRRLTREIIDHRDATRDRTTAWTYDRVGNRLTQVTTTGAGATQATTTVTSTYDANDRLTGEDERTGSAAPRITTTAYDANGNTTRKESPDGVTEYTWDDANRLKEQRTASGRTEYRYDADGLRIGQTTYPTTGTPKRTDYVVDPTYAYANVIERWEGATAGTTKLAAVHVFGEGVLGQVGCTPTATSAPTDCPTASERILHADGFGSTRYLTNPTGTITDRIDYDAFGNEIAREGTTNVEHLYRGEQYDANLGYYYLRARYMDPARGRFASMDPFAGFARDPQSVHKFTYAHQNPIAHADPSGYAVLIGTVTVDAFLNVAVTGYRNASSARRAYSSFDRVRRTMCKGCDRVGDTLRRLDGHHTLPVFMGGRRDQPLLDVPEEIHRALHTLLHYALIIEGFGVPNRGRYYDTFTGPGGGFEQRRAYAVLLRVSRFVDTACIGSPGYQRIAPTVRRMIRTNQIDF
jgi:RHS repeat-associated protein